MAPADPSLHPLQREWAATCRALGASDEAAIARNWVVLEALYNHPPRQYHNLDHIRECLDVLRPIPAPAPDQAALTRLALFAHDCIYDSHRHDNEARSAAVAAMLTRDLAIPAPHIASIERLILATTHRGTPADGHEALIRDIDLASLAADPVRFDDNTRRIRAEFAWASDEQFRAGRLAFFRDMLARPSIYFLPEFQQSSERAARANLERAIREMGG